MTINLRPLTLDDAEKIRIWRNANLASWRTPFLLTEEMQADWYRNVVCNRNTPHRFWAVDDGSGRLAGMVGLTNIQWENRLCELNLIMDPDSMRLADAAVDHLLGQAFNYLGLATVTGECYLCSPLLSFWQRTAERYEAFTTILPRRKFWGGVFHDGLYLSIDEQTYRRAKGLRQ